MTAFRGLRRLLRVPRPVEEAASREVEAEMGFHIDMRAAELEASGMAAAEARRRALEEFGDVEAARRALTRTAASVARRGRARTWWSDVRLDARLGVRGLRRNPGFAAVSLLTLALGMGAAVAIFSVVNGVLLRPLPWTDPDRLVMVR
jgi:hypothetical protein